MQGHGPQGLDGIHAEEDIPLPACGPEALQVRQVPGGELDGGEGQGPDLRVLEGGQEVVLSWEASFVGGDDAQADPPVLQGLPG